jgi:hypothetical protein
MIIPAEKLAGQNSAYRHQKYEGRFRRRRRPSLFYAANTLLLKEKNFLKRCLTLRNVLVYVLPHHGVHRQIR